MGYSEIPCNICGVSFNIGRIRRPDEPPSAAWDGTGYSFKFFVRSQLEARYRCPPEAGCLVVPRKVPWLPRRHNQGNVESENSSRHDDSGDEDYVYQSAEDDDPYEYDTPAESESEDATTEDVDKMDIESDAESEPGDLYTSFFRAFVPGLDLSMPGEDEEMLTQHPHPEPEDGIDRRFPKYNVTHELEHIAGGLGCELNARWSDNGGYNGHAISVAEMQGCNTLQCLVRKPDWWVEEPDDEDFEIAGHFFLSGLSDLMRSRDDGPPTVFPPRHGCEHPDADNIFWQPEKAEEYAMPFHPSCLEVFKRASLLRNGSVDLEGLVSWWALEAAYDIFSTFPREPAVNTSQWFEHVSGDEFVVANPLFVSHLPAVLASADRRYDATFTFNQPVFHPDHINTGPGDMFSSLPHELKAIILSHLKAKDIANLRLASRSFRHLSQSFFRSFILREMPWLWETWSSQEYSFWATTTSTKLRKEDDKRRGQIADIKVSIKTLLEEGLEHGEPDMHGAAIAALKQREAEINEAARRSRVGTSAPLLLTDKTDWYRLCCEVARNMSSMLGLRNRRRIWRDCEEILDRIERYRAVGEIVPGKVVDARATAQATRARTIDANMRWQRYCEAGRLGVYSPAEWGG